MNYLIPIGVIIQGILDLIVISYMLSGESEGMTDESVTWVPQKPVSKVDVNRLQGIERTIKKRRRTRSKYVGVHHKRFGKTKYPSVYEKLINMKDAEHLIIQIPEEIPNMKLASCFVYKTGRSRKMIFRIKKDIDHIRVIRLK